MGKCCSKTPIHVVDPDQHLLIQLSVFPSSFSALGAAWITARPLASVSETLDRLVGLGRLEVVEEGSGAGGGGGNDQRKEDADNDADADEHAAAVLAAERVSGRRWALVRGEADRVLSTGGDHTALLKRARREFLRFYVHTLNTAIRVQFALDIPQDAKFRVLTDLTADQDNLEALPELAGQPDTRNEARKLTPAGLVLLRRVVRLVPSRQVKLAQDLAAEATSDQMRKIAAFNHDAAVDLSHHDPTGERLDDAFTLFEQALALRQQLHADPQQEALVKESTAVAVAETLQGMANIRARQGQFASALELYRNSLNTAKSSVGLRHTVCATSLNAIGTILDTMGEHEEALTVHRQAYALRCKTLGDTHPESVSTLNNVACVVRGQGKHKKALKLFNQVLDARRSEAKFEGDGLDGVDVATTLNNIAVAELSLGQTEAAHAHLDEALAILRRRAPGGDSHESIGDTLVNMGWARLSAGAVSPALEALQEGLDIILKHRPAVHPSVATALVLIAQAWRRKGMLDKAEASALRGLEVRRQLFGDTNGDVAAALVELGQVYRLQKRHAEAVHVLETAADTYDALPADTPVHANLSDAARKAAMVMREREAQVAAKNERRRKGREDAAAPPPGSGP